MVCLIGCDSNNLEIATNPINFKEIEAQGVNGLCSVGASLCNFERIAILAYLDNDSLDFSLPNAHCFNKKGEELEVIDCYASLPEYLKNNLCVDSTKKRIPFWIVHNSDSKKTSFNRRKNLKRYLDDNEVFLLDNRRLNINMLPSSDYYLFIHWFYFTLPGIGDSMSEMDSIANMYPDKVTLVFIHATNPKIFVTDDN